MLNQRHFPYAGGSPRIKQRGATLLVTLIVLVAMTLTAITLMRSMDTTNIIAGNLAFQQSATRSADTGVEAAINWMQANAVNLQNDSFANGYSSSVTTLAAGQSWDNFFTVTLAGRTYTVPTGNPGNADAVGNTVSYAIERLCLTANILPTAVGAGCTVTPLTTSSTGSSEDAGTVKLNTSTQQYYRITSRTVGPHNAKSYVQVIVAM